MHDPEAPVQTRWGYSSIRMLLAQEPDEGGDADTAITASAEPGGFMRDGVTYAPGDCVYVTPGTFDCLEDEDEPKVEVCISTALMRKTVKL